MESGKAGGRSTEGDFGFRIADLGLPILKLIRYLGLMIQSQRSQASLKA